MMVLESRKYGFSRAVGAELAKVQPRGAWLHVNDVAGFIGPEVFRTREQLVRCCLEDIAMGKLHGLPIGLDVCSTLHMAVSLEDLDWCQDQVMPANPVYLIALPTKNDPMLGYLTTSFQDHVRLRERFGFKVDDAMWSLNSRRDPNTSQEVRREGLYGRPVVEHLSRGGVEAGDDLIHAGLAHLPEIGPLGEVPPEQPVGRLVRAPLPGAIGVGEIGPHAELLPETGVQVMLAAVVQGGGFAGLPRQPAEEQELHIAGLLGADLRHLAGKDEAGDALDLGVDPGFMPVPDDRVAFPVSELRALADLCRPVTDRDAVGDLHRPALPPEPAPSLLVAAGEVFPEFLLFLRFVVDELVDRFVVDVFRFRTEPFAYLLA
jgi:hypothetical protein